MMSSDTKYIMEYIASRGGSSDEVVITFSEHEDHQKAVYYVTPINYLPTPQKGQNPHLVVDVLAC